MQLVDATVDDTSTREAIQALVEIKKSGVEHYMTIVNKNLVTYAQNLANYYNETDDALEISMTRCLMMC